MPNLKVIVNSSFIFILLSFLLNSCSESTSPPPPVDKPIEAALAIADTGLVELSLNLKLQNAVFPLAYSLSRNKMADTTRGDTLIYSGTLTTSDTLFYDSNLKPQTEYSYRLLLNDSLGIKRDTFDFTLSTMDTTSHDFSWQVFEFGGEPGTGSSYLNDVAIINPDDIWAVGSITLRDSVGELQSYNAVHWDGEKWELKRIEVIYRGNPSFAPLNGVFAFDSDNVWFSSGLPYKPLGNNKWQLYHLWDMGVLDDEDRGVNKIWGTSSSNLYVVGGNGTIVHYNGNSWQKLESGTDVNLTDVWGTPDGSVIWACGLDRNTNTTDLIEIKNNSVQIKYRNHALGGDGLPDTLSGSLRSGAYVSPRHLFIQSHKRLYYQNRIFNNYQSLPQGHVFPTLNRMAAQKLNDVILCGYGAYIYYYNGSHITTHEFPGSDNSLVSVDYKGNTVCSVGWSGNKAFIVLGSN